MRRAPRPAESEASARERALPPWAPGGSIGWAWRGARRRSASRLLVPPSTARVWARRIFQDGATIHLHIHDMSCICRCRVIRLCVIRPLANYLGIPTCIASSRDRSRRRGISIGEIWRDFVSRAMAHGPSRRAQRPAPQRLQSAAPRRVIPDLRYGRVHSVSYRGSL
jgi:hypothetical protein